MFQLPVRPSYLRMTVVALALPVALVAPAPPVDARPPCDNGSTAPICDGERPPPPRPQPVAPDAALAWSVPERTVIDRLSSYRPVEVAPRAWPVDLSACTSRGKIVSYTWDLGTHGTHRTTDCSFRFAFPNLGIHPVSVTVSTDTGQTDRTSTSVTVRDLLVVAVGDSISAGEGNPFNASDRPASAWENTRCHRSTVAGVSQAALHLERRDPQSSVTFLNLSCSGASIVAGAKGDGGLLTPYAGFDAKPSWAKLPPQVDEALSRTRGRRIDALLVSAGGNDMQFSRVVEECLRTNTYCSDTDAAPRKRTEGLIKDRLPGLYDQLAATVARQLNPRRVLITEYPDVTRSERGLICDPLMTTPTGRIARREAIWARDNVIQAMNAQIVQAAERHRHLGWTAVTGIFSDFGFGGYCASSKHRMIRTWTESFALQGSKDGTLHPNAFGHGVIARRLTPALLSAADR